ncbi:MAG: MFS transporter [Leptospiraceae bacterium]|nr:MFS transporter [Leptospiraceae bacterium]MDW7976261.1 MFS transporter [Leptospiraceae bacterium]
MQRKRAPFKEIFGWAMFDFANSSYTTVIITVVFSVIFPKIIVGDAPEFRLGNFLWSLSLSISYALIVLTAPLFGAIMDFTATKKKFLFFSYLLTVITTALLFFIQPGDILLAVILIILSNFGFAAGESFVSSFLPDLGPQEELGKISGFAWGLGYFGGLFSTAIVIFGLGEITLENYDNLRWVGPITALFFLMAGIPTFLFLKEHGVSKTKPENQTYLEIGWSRILKTFQEIRDFRDLMIFFISMFFSQAGLSIVISFAFIYGDQIVKWKSSTMVIMFVLTQFTAAAGAFLFGWIQDRLGALKTYVITLVLWIFSILAIYFTEEITMFLNQILNLSLSTEQAFLIVGVLAGTGLGATQSSGRAIVGMFSPESKSGEFFGFWGVAGKLSAIFGLLSLGILQTYLGLKNAVLFTATLFIISIVIAFVVNEERGKQSAIQHEGE